MLKLINKYKRFLILISFAYIYIVAILLIPSKVRVLTPGETTNTFNIYNVEEVEINKNFNTLSVYNWHNVTVFQKWITENNVRYDQSEIRKDLTRKDLGLQGRISNESSHNNAVITAYKYANKINSNITINYELQSLTIYDTNSNNLKIGDEIIKINNESITTNSYEDYLSNLNLYNNNKYIKNTNSILTIKRGNEVIEINLNENEALYFYPKYEILNTSPKYLGFKEDLNVGGPSGGAIQAISLYTSLLNIDLKNVKIAGTGTIETNNNFSIGNIGGVVQKYYTALNNQMNYLILPKDNFNELRMAISNLNKDLTVISVESFDDLIKLVGDIS